MTMQFVTNAAGGVKGDGGKYQPRLLMRSMPNALEQVSKVLTYGANKYTVEVDLPFDIFKNEFEQKCQELITVNAVKDLNVLLVEGFALPATGTKQCQTEFVTPVEKKHESLPRRETVEFVTKKTDSVQDLTRQLLNESIKKSIVTGKVLEKKSANERQLDAKTQITYKIRKEDRFLEILQDTLCLSRNIEFCVNVDVEFAEAKSDHTLTMIMKQGNLEIYFVVNATKLSDCYKTVQKLFSASTNISLTTRTQYKVAGADNWKKVEDDRYWDALHRHLLAHAKGETVDSETGESHLAHALCCLLFLLEKRACTTGQNVEYP